MVRTVHTPELLGNVAPQPRISLNQVSTAHHTLFFDPNHSIHKMLRRLSSIIETGILIGKRNSRVSVPVPDARIH